MLLVYVASSPASFIHGNGVCHFFLIFYTIFYLFMFRYTNAHHCVPVAYSIQYSNMLYGFAAQEQ